MPTYEYACVDCGNRFEIFRRIGDEPLTLCEVCGGSLRKVFHPAGILLKGSGFYKTDSRSATSKTESGSEPATKGDQPKKKSEGASEGSREGRREGKPPPGETKEKSA